MRTLFSRQFNLVLHLFILFSVRSTETLNILHYDSMGRAHYRLFCELNSSCDVLIKIETCYLIFVRSLIARIDSEIGEKGHIAPTDYVVLDVTVFSVRMYVTRRLRLNS